MHYFAGKEPLLLITFFFIVLVVASFGLLLKQLKKEPRTLRLGFLTLLLLFNVVVVINLLFFLAGLTSVVLLVELLGFLFLILFFPFILAIYLIYQTIVLWRKESHTFSNFLLTLSLIFYVILTMIVGILNRSLPSWGQRLLIFVPLISLYLTITFANFFLSSFVYGLYMNFRRTKNNKLVILGGGLIEGKFVGRLLGNRIKAAIKYSQKIAQPEFVFSGGQGTDEKISEALAMKDYALEQGIPADSIVYLEDRSINTKENLLFSSRILKNDSFIFFTSDYHVFRAALLAKSLQILANGKGGKTPLYYRGTAFLREYIGIMVMNKKRHLIAFLIIMIISLLSMLSLVLRIGLN